MRIIKTGFAVALIIGVSVANAAGLGKLTINSALGQPLNAEIDLVSLQAGELESLTAKVAPPEAFRDARIEYASSLRLLRFSVEKRAGGQPYLKVTSVGAINEPFLDALIEVTWPQGRIQREYPILLDPPGYSQKPTAPTVAAAPASAAPQTPPASAPAASSSTAAPAPAATVTPAATTGTGTPSASAELTTPPGTPAGAASGDSYGPVKKGDTLRKIAEEVKPSNVNLEQMLVALYRENKTAFVNNNMNRLKAGQILKVPSADVVNAVETKDANKEVRTHVADWKGYREQVASGVGSLPARPESSSTSTGRISSAAVTPSAPPAAEAKDVLKLSKSTSSKAGTPGRGSDRAAALQEELTAKENALRESQSRVADLEKQIQNMQRMMDLKSGAPAKADAKVAAVPPAPTKAPEPVKAPEPPKVAEVKKPEPAKLEPVKPADTKLAAVAPTPEPAKTDPPKADATKPGEPAKTEPAKTEPAKTEPAKTAEAPPTAPTPPKADVPKTAAKPAAKKPPPPPPSFTDELMENPAYLVGGLGVLALLGGGAFMFMRRRKRKSEEGPSSAMTSAFPSDLKVDSTTGKPAAGLVDTGNSSFLTDFDKAGPGTIDTDEVDPVAEAEVYIAYGRDTQAEEILKEAMARDRSRPEIMLKLLEIYHARKSATAFESVAKELHETAGDSPMWQKAAAMGAQIDPNNPLYGGADANAVAFAAPEPVEAPKPDFDLDGSTSSAPAPDFNLDSDSSRPTDGGLDFDINAAAPAEAHSAAAPAAEEKASFDFDLSGLDFPGADAKPASGTDLDLDTEKSKPVSSVPSFDLSDLSLEPAESAAPSGGEGMSTQLELAKAYLEIGDKDGAREILQEVAKGGSPAQQVEAHKLIASL